MPHFEQNPGQESSASSKELLAAQFDTPETMSVVEGGTVDVIDLQPEHPKTETPTVWLPGWGANASVHKENIVHLASLGRRTLTIDAPHGIKTANVPDLETQKGIHEIELKNVAALFKALDAKGIKQADLVGHSQGSMHAMYAALLKPERFRSLVLVDPAGMIGQDSFFQLVRRAASDGAFQSARIKSKDMNEASREQARSQLAIGDKALRKVIAANPLQAVKSLGVVTSTQIHEMLEAVREKGVKIAIVHAVDDKLFPMNRIQEQTERKMVDGFYSVKGSHNELYLHPERYTELVDSALDGLEKLRKKEV